MIRAWIEDIAGGLCLAVFIGALLFLSAGAP